MLKNKISKNQEWDPKQQLIIIDEPNDSEYSGSNIIEVNFKDSKIYEYWFYDYKYVLRT